MSDWRSLRSGTRRKQIEQRQREAERREQETRRLRKLMAKKEEEERKKQEYLRMLQEYPIPEWLTPYSQKLNIAIVGPSGAGKSSLNNRFRGLRKRKLAEERGLPWCATGSTETTMFATPYPVLAPGGSEGAYESGILLWDLPGVGTPRFPKETYFRDVGLRHFQCVLLVSSQRFTENDKAISDECKRVGRECIFVRTKVDVDIEREEEDNDMGEKQVLDKIRGDLQRHGVSHPYLVSAKEPDFDMDLLRKKILGSLDSVVASGANEMALQMSGLTLDTGGSNNSSTQKTRSVIENENNRAIFNTSSSSSLNLQPEQVAARPSQTQVFYPPDWADRLCNDAAVFREEQESAPSIASH
ncbi:unnamed protein product [Amoebophrya sp. A120]|nr:unnamed protein product [Amoebophrya sp. A120]|eukprot:GSA120T00000246001.1